MNIRCSILPVTLLVLGVPAFASTYNTGDRNSDATPRTAPAMVPVGPGNTDSSPRNIVRTSKDVLYVVAASGTAYVTSPPTNTRLIAYGATTAGTPTAFKALDIAHEPGHGVNASASAIDGADRIHSVWIAPNIVGYGIFDTKTNLWTQVGTLAATHWDNYGQGYEGAAIAVDAAGNPYAVWNSADPASGHLHLNLAIAKNGVFGAPVPVDDVDVNGGAWHPSVGFAPNGDFVVAWIDGDGNYQGAGFVRTRVLHSNGQWDASYVVPGVTAGSSLDQSNSLLITADGTRHITFLDDNNVVQYFYDKVDGNGWRGDQQPPYQVTHDPVLGLDGAGGLYIYGHATPVGGTRVNNMGVLIDGLGNGKDRFHKAAGATAWSAYDLVRDGLIDDASSVRWSQFFYNHPEEVDFTWWNHTPNTNDGSGYFLEVGVGTIGGTVLAGTTILQSQPVAPPNDQLDQQAAHPSAASGIAQAFSITAAASGTAAKIGIYVDATNETARAMVGLYADAGGQPGALLASALLTGVQIGRGQWHEVALASAPSLVAGQNYWIAVLSPNGGNPFAYRASAAGPASVASASTTLKALPAQWTSSATGSPATFAGYVVGK